MNINDAIEKLEGEGMSDYQTQAKICPFCHDDHSAMTCYENKLKQENARLRELLWFNHGHTDSPMLYGDDGEMQCNTCMIDFKRDSVEEIERKIIEYNQRMYLKVKQALEAGDEV